MIQNHKRLVNDNDILYVFATEIQRRYENTIDVDLADQYKQLVDRGFMTRQEAVKNLRDHLINLEVRRRLNTNPLNISKLPPIPACQKRTGSVSGSTRKKTS